MSGFGKHAAVWRITLMSQWVYTADAVFRSLFLGLIVTIYVQLWTRTLAARGAVAGLTARELVWYLVYTEAILLACPRADETLAEEVRSGDIAYRLVRPIPYLTFHLAGFLGESTVRFFVNLLVGGTAAWVQIGPPPIAFAAVPAVAVVTALGFVLAYCCLALIGLGAFWVQETRPYAWIYGKLMFTLGGLLVPNDFMPEWMAQVAGWLPFGAVLYGPARLTLEFEPAFALHVLVVQVIWIGALAALARAAFRAGTRRLDAQGG